MNPTTYRLLEPDGAERLVSKDDFDAALRRLAEARAASAHQEAQSRQVLKHWAAMTRARAEELRFIGMGPAADRLDKLADELTQG